MLVPSNLLAGIRDSKGGSVVLVTMGDKCPGDDEALVPSIRLSRIVCFSSCRQTYSILSTSYNVYSKDVQHRNYSDYLGKIKRSLYILLLRAGVTMTCGNVVPRSSLNNVRTNHS
jgi:hypothetical protein